MCVATERTPLSHAAGQADRSISAAKARTASTRSNELAVRHSDKRSTPHATQKACDPQCSDYSPENCTTAHSYPPYSSSHFLLSPHLPPFIRLVAAWAAQMRCDRPPPARAWVVVHATGIRPTRTLRRALSTAVDDTSTSRVRLSPSLAFALRNAAATSAPSISTPGATTQNTTFGIVIPSSSLTSLFFASFFRLCVSIPLPAGAPGKDVCRLCERARAFALLLACERTPGCRRPHFAPSTRPISPAPTSNGSGAVAPSSRRSILTPPFVAAGGRRGCQWRGSLCIVQAAPADLKIHSLSEELPVVKITI